jgi:hypothetical protein
LKPNLKITELEKAVRTLTTKKAPLAAVEARESKLTDGGSAEVFRRNGSKNKGARRHLFDLTKQAAGRRRFCKVRKAASPKVSLGISHQSKRNVLTSRHEGRRKKVE